MAGCVHFESCPCCRNIALQKKRVDSGLIITNYDSSSSFLAAVKLSGDTNLEHSAQQLVESYVRKGATSLCAVRLYAPPLMFDFISNTSRLSDPKHVYKLPTDPAECGNMILGCFIAMGASFQVTGIYDHANQSVIAVGEKASVENIVRQYTEYLPKWFQTMKCQKHSTLSQ